MCLTRYSRSLYVAYIILLLILTLILILILYIIDRRVRDA